MTRFSADQLDYADSRTGYLDRERAREFLRTMDIRMSVGHWSAEDFCDRFAPPGYHTTVNSACLEHGIRLAIEPKPYEPRELYLIVQTAASAILVAIDFPPW